MLKAFLASWIPLPGFDPRQAKRLHWRGRLQISAFPNWNKDACRGHLGWNSPLNGGRSSFGDMPGTLKGWLGREAPTLRLAEPKSAALPLGYAPPAGCSCCAKPLCKQGPPRSRRVPSRRGRRASRNLLFGAHLLYPPFASRRRGRAAEGGGLLNR